MLFLTLFVFSHFFIKNDILYVTAFLKYKHLEKKYFAIDVNKSFFEIINIYKTFGLSTKW